MSDILTLWNTTRGDWSQDGGDLASGNDIVSAVLISLFTDRTANSDDAVPDATRRLRDPRGWWGDAGPYLIGSRLWLIDRAKRTQETLQRAQGYILEALQWLLDDGAASRIDVSVEWSRQNTLAAQVVVYSPRTGKPIVKVGTQNVFRLPDAQAWGWNAEHGVGQWVELVPGTVTAQPLPPGLNYQQQIAYDVPLVWWKLDEPAGVAVAADSGTLGLPLTLKTAQVTTGVPALCGTGAAMSINSGAPNPALAPNSSALNFGAGDFTISALVKTSVAPAGNVLGIVGVATTNVDFANWFLQIDFSGNLRLDLLTSNDLATLHEFLSPVPVNDGVRHCVVARRAGNVITLWQDGLKVLTGTFTGTLWASDSSVGVGSIPWVAGANSNVGVTPGVIDEVAIWNRALPDARILAQYGAIDAP